MGLSVRIELGLRAVEELAGDYRAEPLLIPSMGVTNFTRE